MRKHDHPEMEPDERLSARGKQRLRSPAGAQRLEAMRMIVAFERILIDLASEFVSIKPEGLDAVIERALGAVGTFAGADRAYVFLCSDDGSYMDNTHEWCAAGIEPQKHNLQAIAWTSMPWWHGMLRAGQTIHLPTLDRLPKEAAAEHALLESQDIQSLVVVPLNVNDNLMGFLGFDAVHTRRDWSDTDRDLLRVFGSLIVNVILRCRSEQALRDSDARTRSILQAIPDLMFIHDREGRYLDYHAADPELLAFSPGELMQKNIGGVFPKDIAARILDLFAKSHDTGQKQVMEYCLNVPKGLRWFEARISAIDDRRQLTMVHDITEQKQAETMQQRLQILERLGLLAGGIAHDFNNLLMGVFGNIEIATLQLSEDHAALPALRDAHQALDRTRCLTSRLLTFAKGGNPVMEMVDLRREIPDTVRFNLSGGNVAVTFEIPADLWAAKADRGQIDEVIANLTINAKEAMPSGGTLRVRAENVAVLRGNPVPELHGDAIKLTFSDEGVGIPQNIRERIFDPYFSTKQTGSGLGLAVVHSIVAKHKGHIGVESVPGNGTTFTVFLPAAPGASARKSTDKPPAAARSSSASVRILLMDDEEIVRTVTSRMLESLGYKVETAVDGRDAIDKYGNALRSGKPFDVTIMDLTIPGGMGGEEAIMELRKLDPSAKAIVYSGYASDPVMADYQEYGFCGCLVKPSTLLEIRGEISRVAETSEGNGRGTD